MDSPLSISKYYEKFVHLITREVKGRTVVKPNRAEFRKERAIRIHWIKPILQHWQDPRITHFKFIEAEGMEREYFWFKAKFYMVILEEISPDYLLITGFRVDEEEVYYYEKKYTFRETI